MMMMMMVDMVCSRYGLRPSELTLLKFRRLLKTHLFAKARIA